MLQLQHFCAESLQTHYFLSVGSFPKSCGSCVPTESLVENALITAGPGLSSATTLGAAPEAPLV